MIEPFWTDRLTKLIDKYFWNDNSKEYNCPKDFLIDVNILMGLGESNILSPSEPNGNTTQNDTQQTQKGVSSSAGEPLETRSMAEEEKNADKGLSIADNHQSAETRKGCGAFVQGTLEEFKSHRIVGHKCVGDCPRCSSNHEDTSSEVKK